MAVQLFATFTEQLTGKIQNASANVEVHYEISLKLQNKRLKAGLTFTVTAFVNYYGINEPVTDHENTVRFTVGFLNYTQVDRMEYIETYAIIFDQVIENGISILEIQIPENTFSVNVTASYRELTSNTILVEAPLETDFITITSKTETPKITEKILINIKSAKNFTEFSYHVFSVNGRILISDTIQISPSSTNDYDFEIAPTPDMEVEVKIIVFYITEYGYTAYDTLTIEFEDLKNFVNIRNVDSGSEIIPADRIELNISSNSNSFVGILGIDQRVLLLKDGTESRFLDNVAKVETNELDFFHILHSGFIRDVISYRYGHYFKKPDDWMYFHARHSRLYKTEITETKLPETEWIPKVVRMPSSEITIRKTFSETWLFSSVDFEANQTSAVITEKIPDTITSWIIVAFSINPSTGIAVTEQPVKLNSSLILSISIVLPYSIRRGEILSIPVYVSNNTTDVQKTTITFYNENSEFDFMEEESNTIDADRKEHRKTILVPAESLGSTSFRIHAKAVGSIKIKVVAESPSTYGDGIERYLLVKPEGITQYKNAEIFVDQRIKHNFTTDVRIQIPMNAIADSIKLEASIDGDVLGLTIGNGEELLQMIEYTFNCEKQSLMNFVRNFVILDYLTAVHKTTPEIRRIATLNLNLTYHDQLLCTHCDDALFTIRPNFYKRSGSTWITAFLAKMFRNAAKYILIEGFIIEKALELLAQRQADNGSFVEVGYRFRDDIQAGPSNEIALTAFAVIAFLENAGHVEKSYRDTIDKALIFLSENFDNITDNYTLAITTYAFQLADHEQKHVSISKLEVEAVKYVETMYLEGKLSESLNIGMAGYSLLALLKADRLTDAVRIMKGLVLRRNEIEGFISTQYTMIGLQALTKIAAIVYSNENELNIEIIPFGSEYPYHTFHVAEKSLLIHQRRKLPSSASDFRISASGNGFGIFRISYQYNIPTGNEFYGFHIDYTVFKTKYEKLLRLHICTNYIEDGKFEKSTVEMIAEFPSGYEYSKILALTKRIKKVIDRRTSVIVLFNELADEAVCVDFMISKHHHIERPQSASILLEDKSNRRAHRIYDLSNPILSV